MQIAGRYARAPRLSISRTAVRCALVLAALLGTGLLAQTPAEGIKAPDFTLNTLTGQPVQLAKQMRGNPLVLVILRGYPGYQCPFCQRQVHDFIQHAAEFSAKKATVLLVYPGPSAGLDQHAGEFLTKQADLPAHILLVTDPDYKVTNLYGLRWNAPQETAYPSTFVLDSNGTILFEKISHSHGDRLSAQEALDHIPAK